MKRPRSEHPRNIKLTIEYDGTRYHGWQIQRNRRTIQAEIVKAIKRVTGEQVTLYGAGRTDKGVHALGQVANFKTHSMIKADRFAHALNTHLPMDITIRAAQEVPEDFHAQFSAVSKTYRYTILNRDTPSAVKRNYYYLVHERLDVEKMQEAAHYFIGEKDFRAFASEGWRQENTVRRIESFYVKRDEEWVTFEVTANGFLYNMVRTIVGTLLLVGLGKVSPYEIKTVLDSCDRRQAGSNASPKGLCLMEVRY